MKRINLDRSSEKSIYLIFWILVFTLPILLSTGGSKIDWSRVLHEWIRFTPFLCMFLVNNFALFILFGKKRYTSYFLLVLLTIGVFSFAGSFNPQIYDLLGLRLRDEAPIRNDLLRILNTFFYNFMVCVLGIGLNDAIKITIHTLQERGKLEELQKEHFQNQLSLLQHQISPHFFMNTLNNIHALVDYDKEIAKNSVVKLSKLMRVLLYENQNFTLQKEVEFVSDYIELMKIRVSENVEIKFEYPGNIPPLNFPPLLFISFVENAFKHGILANGKSFIYIYFVIENDNLHFRIQNSRTLVKTDLTDDEKIGLNNSRKRLDLLYGKKYKFEVSETNATYEVNVCVPLYEDKMPGH